ncbi:hypothetical protein OLMES_0267 [Oleiphilus messinensis]|uniref:Uncharacterized protein n=1 Tax=Oleiphilus messinensis TaxID=141451 RepID=A0A1Y0I4N1_9GAMM|nr:hypothetical protein [Oleiphilus messinensis]ARU54373.1 hypothetical protein OLMES_0267 [Oleiphilus messinensis]
MRGWIYASLHWQEPTVLRHFNPVIPRADTRAVVTGLFAVFALEVTIGVLRVEEVLKGFIQVDTSLLECNRVKLLEPVILA